MNVRIKTFLMNTRFVSLPVCAWANCTSERSDSLCMPPAVLPQHGCGSKWPSADRSACSFSRRPSLDGADSVVRGEAAACFFCSKVTVGVTFPSQALSAKSWYLPACWFTHLAWLSLSGTRPSGSGREGGWRRRQPWRIRVQRGLYVLWWSGKLAFVCAIFLKKGKNSLCSFDIPDVTLVFVASHTVGREDQYQFQLGEYSTDKPREGISRDSKRRETSAPVKPFSISPFYVSVTHVHMKTFFRMPSLDICSLAGDVTVGTGLKTRKQMEQVRTDRNYG